MEELPAIAGSSVKLCARAATVGVGDERVSVKRLVVAKAVALPPAGSASLVIGLGLDRGVVAAAVDLVSRVVLPHLLFIGTVRRGPTSH